MGHLCPVDLFFFKLFDTTDAVEQPVDDVHDADNPKDVLIVARLLCKGGVVKASDSGAYSEGEAEDEKKDFQTFLHTIFVVFVHNIIILTKLGRCN